MSDDWDTDEPLRFWAGVRSALILYAICFACWGLAELLF
jgi:hypothetical protein